MQNIAPFAYGVAGSYLVATDTHEVFVCGDDDQGPLWTHSTDAPVAGVANTHHAILVLDCAGSLQLLDRPTGNAIGNLSCPVECTGLSAAATGRWVATHRNGVVVGENAMIQQQFDNRNARYAAINEDGIVAVGTENTIEILNENQQRETQIVSGRVSGLAWNPMGGWLVSTDHAIWNFSSDLAKRICLVSLKDNLLSGGVVAPSGRIVAFRMGERSVVIIGRQKGQLGIVQYGDRTVGELDFGPHPYLGIGIGIGDGNRISLVDNVVERTDPPQNRTRNRWLLGVDINYQKVKSELKSNRNLDDYGSGKGCLGALTIAVVTAILTVSVGCVALFVLLA